MEFNVDDINMIVLMKCISCGIVKKNTLMGEMFPEGWIEVLKNMQDEVYICGKCQEGINDNAGASEIPV